MSAPAKAQAKPQPQAPAAPAASETSGAAGRGRTIVIALGLSGVGAGLAVYALPIFILLYGGLLPTLVAYLTDERRGKHLLITVAAMNGAGVVLACRAFFSSAFSLDAGLRVAADPANWLMMYGFAMAGWFLAWILPMMVSHALDLVYRQRQNAAEAAREALVAQWPGMIGPNADQDEPGESAAPSAPVRPRRGVQARG